MKRFSMPNVKSGFFSSDHKTWLIKAIQNKRIIPAEQFLKTWEISYTSFLTFNIEDWYKTKKCRKFSEVSLPQPKRSGKKVP